MKLAAPLVLVLVVLLAAVYWDDTAADSDVVFVNRGEVFTLDPQRMSYLQDFRMAYALYEGLLRWNNHTMAIEPAAAASLPEVSADGLTYTFKLRGDAHWSNGDPVTAHDFAYSWRRLLWPETSADYSNLFFLIEGADEFFAWRTEQTAAFTADTSISDPAARATAAQELLKDAELRFRDTVGIVAVDDHTLRVRLRRPVAYFQDLLCFAVCYPVHRPTVEGWEMDDAMRSEVREKGWHAVTPPAPAQRRYVKVDPQTGGLEQQHEWARPETWVSNGPMILTQWRYKRDLRLEPNPLFHDRTDLANRSVVSLAIEDTNTMVLAFESGKIDWLSDVTAEYVPDMLAERKAYEDRYRKEIDALLSQGETIDEALAALPPPQTGERRNIHVLPTFGTDFYNFNCRPKLSNGRDNPFADARVRRAFVMSVDKQAMVRDVTRLNEPVSTTLIPRGSIPGYTSPEGLPYDVVRAREELSAAGWKDRDRDGLIENEALERFPVVDLLYTTNTPRYKWISLNLRDQWQQALGVEVELRAADTKFYKEELKLGQYMIARARWYGDYSDPTTFLDINRTADGNNDRGYSNPKFDQLLEDAANEVDPQQRMRTLEEAERLLMDEEAPLIPLCQLVQVYMYEPGKMNGLTEHPRLIQYLWRLTTPRSATTP